MKQIQPLTNSQQRKCEGSFYSSSFWRSLRQVLQYHVLTSLWHRVRVHAWPVIHAIRSAGTSSYKLYAALIIIALGPLAEVSYRLFDASAGNPAVSYWNAYYFLNAIGDDMSTLLYVTGFYLMLPEFSKVKFIALIPASYKFAHICWMPFVTDNTMYHQFTPISFLMLGAAAALWWFVIFEYVMHLHFHKKAGIWARIAGILTAPGIDDAHRVAIAKKEIETYNSLK